MKHSLFALFAMLILPLAADDLKINGNFKDSIPGAESPRGWSTHKYPGAGTSKVVQEGSDLAVSMKATSKDATMVSFNSMFDVQPGDVLEFSAYVKGKGTFRFGYVAYTMDGAFLKTVPGLYIQLTDSFSKQKAELKIAAISGKKLEKVRIALLASPNAEVVVKDVKAELENGADAEGKLPVNGKFYGSTDKTTLPPGWRANGPAKTSVSRDGDDFVLSMGCPGKQDSFVSYETMYPVVDGDTLEFEAEIKGKGPVRLGYFGYSADGKFVRTNMTPGITPTDKFQEVKSSVKIKGTAAKKVEKISVVIMAPVGSDFQIKKLKVNLVPVEE